jgi:hypothetical protein
MSRVVTSGADRGLHFMPRCDRRWFLALQLGSEFPGSDGFTPITDVVPGGGGVEDPWSSIDLDPITARPVPEPTATPGGVAAVGVLAGHLARRRRIEAARAGR